MKKILYFCIAVMLLVVCCSAGCISQHDLEMELLNGELYGTIPTYYEGTYLIYNPNSVAVSDVVIYFTLYDQPNSRGNVVDTLTYHVGTLKAGESKKISISMSANKNIQTSSVEYQWEWV
ncbi:MAG: FxLYD domain-containing protein [Candidatus Delongbacteria bacterium]|nr:FxLYD domain-containing protein [Candidatus Delongbacteria bacterium]